VTFDDLTPEAPAPGSDPRQTGEMGFLDHLEELRRVIQQALAACLIGALAGWWLAPRVLEDLIHRTVGSVIVLSPIEAFSERLKLALVIGLMIALPFVFHRIWAFIVPGLLKKERGFVLPLAAVSMLLFATGVAASYFYLTPLVVHALSQFLTPSMNAQIQVGALLGFFYNLALACGLVMQLPLLTMALTAIGIVTPGFLLRHWRYALIGVFVVTAAITPGDIVTAQIVMAGPMIVLYFASVGLAWLVVRRRRTQDEADGLTPASRDPMNGGEHA
jgi:sec-independent protein translocase protein TatC